MSSETIFDKIIQKIIPASIVFEDEDCLAFKDINPCAPVHIILIPKVKDNLTGLIQAEQKNEKILGHLMIKAAEIAKQNGLADNGFRLVVNDGPFAGQTVNHLHLHIIGGQQMFWPPGTGASEKLKH